MNVVVVLLVFGVMRYTLCYVFLFHNRSSPNFAYTVT